MSEHVSAQSIEEYCRRELAPAKLLAVDDHLATCNECHQLLLRDENLHPALTVLVEGSTLELEPYDDHLTYEQLASLVDGQADEVGKEIANVHLEVCSECAAELKGLYAIRDTVPLPSPEPRRVKLLTGWEQFLLFWRRPGGWAWPRLVGVALAVVVVGTLSLIIWQSQRNAEVAESTHPPVNAASPIPVTVGTPLDLRSQTEPQTSPSPNASPEIVIALDDGGQQVALDAAGNLSGLPSLSPSHYELVKTTLTTQRINRSPELEGLGGKEGVLMGATAEGVPFALVNPVGTVVRSDRPTLHWKPLAGANSYVVKVFDTNFRNIATSPPQAGTAWNANAPLARGSVYVWQVTATRNGEEITSPVAPAPEARFRVLKRDKAVELERAEKTYANSHLILGTIYAHAGLMEDAKREFRLLVKANPRSPVAQKLLQNIR